MCCIECLADAQNSSAAMIGKLLHNPQEANEKLGGGKINAMFIKVYCEFVSLPSAKTAYHDLFLALYNPGNTPALYHCANG